MCNSSMSWGWDAVARNTSNRTMTAMNPSDVRMPGKETGVCLALCLPVVLEEGHQSCEVNVGGRGGSVKVRTEKAHGA